MSQNLLLEYICNIYKNKICNYNLSGNYLVAIWDYFIEENAYK